MLGGPKDHEDGDAHTEVWRRCSMRFCYSSSFSSRQTKKSLSCHVIAAYSRKGPASMPRQSLTSSLPTCLSLLELGTECAVSSASMACASVNMCSQGRSKSHRPTGPPFALRPPLRVRMTGQRVENAKKAQKLS